MTNKGQTNKKRLPLETDFEQTGSNNFLDFFFGDRRSAEGHLPEKRPIRQREEFTVFKRQDHQESFIIPSEIKKLTDEIKKEIVAIKKANKSLLSQVADIEKTTVESLPVKQGIYHVRFLEIILSILKTLQVKVGEARTWLAAMQTKKKKRGSLFATLSKKKGTQYSLSHELQASRSVM